MSAGTLLLFLLVIVGMPIMMMLMHRGGHAGGMGCCGMGHDHHSPDPSEKTPAEGDEDEYASRGPGASGEREPAVPVARR